MRLAQIVSSILITSAVFTTNATSVETKGGVKVGMDNEPYWFSLGGALQLDERLFSGNKTSNYKSGGTIAGAGLWFNGGLGRPELSYTLNTSFDAKESKTNIDNLFVNYKYRPNWNLSFGLVEPGFCFELLSSGLWQPFLERSMATTAFDPCGGLGIATNLWGDMYSIIINVTQPKPNETVSIYSASTGTATTAVSRSDRWKSTARLAFIPVHNPDQLLQIGLSGHVQDDHHALISFSTNPEASARNVTTLLDTGNITAKRHSTIDVELAGQYKQWNADVEYAQAFVSRGIRTGQTATEGQGNLKFKGYHFRASYILTGEHRIYNKSEATFDGIKPNSEFGAWEASVRYSFLNLNDKDITGGTAHNISIGLGWYANEHIRVMSEYVNSRQNKLQDGISKHKIRSFGLRLQAVF